MLQFKAGNTKRNINAISILVFKETFILFLSFYAKTIIYEKQWLSIVINK